MNRPLLWLLGIVCAVILICNAAGSAEKNNVLKNDIGEQRCISGIVDSIPQYKDTTITFTLKMTKINNEEVSGYRIFKPKVQVTLSLYSGTVFPEITAGDMLSLCGELTLAEASRNPGGFNYALYLRGKGIDGLFYVDDASNCSITGRSMHPKYRIYALRTKLSEIIKMHFTEEQSDVIQGILLGDKTIAEDIQTQFSDAGISHLLAVSGLHVSYICVIITWIAGFFKGDSRFKLCLLIPCLIFYCILTGGAVSVIRAALMTAFPLVGEIKHRHYDALSGLCLAALLILCFRPAQLFSAGFQMSFCAVAAIIFLYKPIVYLLQHRFGISGYLSESLCLSFCAAVGTLPAVLYHYHTLNLVSLVANLIMIPLTGFLLIAVLFAIPLLFIIPSLGTIITFIPRIAAQLTIDLSGFFAALPGLKFNGTAPGLLQCIILFIMVLALAGYFNLKEKSNQLKFAAILTSVFSLMLLFSLWPHSLTVTFLDVGQGDCALIETPNGGAYLVDGGGYEGYRAEEKSKANPISEKVLLPALYAKGITRLNGVFITHNHSDHAQGIEEILTKIPVDRVYVTTKYNGTALLKQSVIPVTRLCAGMILSTEDGCTIQVLWPDTEIEAVEDDNQNDASLIFRLIYGKRAFLFTGDAGIETEAKISSVSSDCIKIGHHGSSGSSSAAFLSRVNPAIAVISVGQYNTYGHPTEEVLSNIKDLGALCYRTDLNGAVVVTTNGENLKVQTYLK